MGNAVFPKKIGKKMHIWFQIYLLFFKTHSNGLSNKFIHTLSLIRPPKNVCNFGHWSWAVPVNMAIETRMFLHINNGWCYEFTPTNEHKDLQ